MKKTPIYNKLAVWVLLCTLMLPMVYSFHFYFERMAHRMYMWYEAHHENLETYTLDIHALTWEKKDRELILFGQYFDVVSVKYHQGKAIVKGFFDHKETRMVKAFETENQKNKHKHLASKKLIQWLQHTWQSNKLEFSFHACFTENKYPRALSDLWIPLCKLSIPHPPPWL